MTGLRQLEEIRRLNQTQEQHAQELARSELALREQTRILQSVLDCMGDGVVVADSNARFLVFNPAAARILGHGQTDAASQEWSRHYEIFLPERTTPYPVDDLPLVRAIRGESVDQAELYIAYPSREDGTWILVTGRPLRDEYGALQGGVVVFHDITLRKKAERRLAAQYETTRVLAEADSPAESIQKILQTICECLDWDLGAFWRVDSAAQRLRCAAVWRRAGVQASALEAMNRQMVMERGVGLPGRVWDRAEPDWIPELAADSSFLRRSAAAADGFRTAFAVPILLRGECLGVLEFFSLASRPADPGAAGNDGQPGHSDRSVHRASSDAGESRPVGEARLAGDALSRSRPRDQQSAGVHRHEPGRARARLSFLAHTAAICTRTAKRAWRPLSRNCTGRSSASRPSSTWPTCARTWARSWKARGRE